MPKRRRLERRATESSDDDDDDDGDVVVQSNRIYFYCRVTVATCRDLVMKLRSLDHDLRATSGGTCPIYIHIQSDGGDVDAALCVVGTIRELRAAGTVVVSVVEATAASAATLISVCASERHIREHARMRVHQFSTTVWGKKVDLDDEHHNLDQVEKTLVSIYKRHTSMSKREIVRLLKRELDLKPQDCKRRGLVDRVV